MPFAWKNHTKLGGSYHEFFINTLRTGVRYIHTSILA